MDYGMARPQLNTVTLDFTTAAGIGASLISIPKALSLANRKSYRSGYVYSVDYIEIIAAAGDTFTIAKLPENYNTLGGYLLGFERWRAQRAMAIEATDIQPGKWSDFKPWYNADHADGTLTELNVRGMGAGFILQPLDQTGAEWNMADMEVHDVGAATTTRFPVGMLGDSNVGAGAQYGGLIDAWGVTRSATVAPDPLTPTEASFSWITRTGATSEEMSGEIITLIEDENDFPPYANQTDTTLAPTYVGNGESAPLGMMVDTSVTGTTGRGVNLNGGLFPLGYLVVQSSTDVYTVRVHCTRGDYKGVAAMSMGSFS
jgi:hypothetical protein